LKKPSESPRKSPKQDRSKAIVDAIFEATVRILPKAGSHGITTKKIADLAGISVGSLYQYFPNKESVLGALIDLVTGAEMKNFETRVREIESESMDDAIASLVEFAVELFLIEKEKMREIFISAPELGRMQLIMKLRQSVVERLSEAMKRHAPNKTSEERTLICFVAVNSVMGVIHTMLIDEKQTHSPDELSAELKSMLRAYFQTRMRLV
jgi:AcrR family transcriptional regulator